LAHKKLNNKLASEVLSEALNQWLDDALKHNQGSDFYIDEHAAIWLEYEGASKHELGAFRLDYKPEDAVERIVRECRDLVNNFEFDCYLKREKRKIKVSLKDRLSDDTRERWSKDLSRLATMMLFTALKTHVGEAMQHALEDGMIFAEAQLGNLLAKTFREGSSIVEADMRSDIEEAAQKAAQERKALLRMLLRTLPHILSKRESGRPKASRERAPIRRERVNSNWRKFVAAVNDLGDDIARTEARSLLAQKLKITPRTLSRWLQRDFKMTYEQALRKARGRDKRQKN
jgi:hypothetical protein